MFRERQYKEFDFKREDITCMMRFQNFLVCKSKSDDEIIMEKRIEWYNELKRDENKKNEHIKHLWKKARDKYALISIHKKIQMFQNQNVVDEVDIEKKIEDYDEDDDNNDDNSTSNKWYLIEKDGTFNRFWDFLVTLCIIFTLFVVPVLMIFPKQYQYCEVVEGKQSFWSDSCPEDKTRYNSTIVKIIYTQDIIFLIDILLNFLTKARNMGDENALEKIAKSYMLGLFVFDVAAVVPLFIGEPIRLFGMKLIRVVHQGRVTLPLQLFLEFALQRYSKKR